MWTKARRQRSQLEELNKRLSQEQRAFEARPAATAFLAPSCTRRSRVNHRIIRKIKRSKGEVNVSSETADKLNCCQLRQCRHAVSRTMQL